MTSEKTAELGVDLASTFAAIDEAAARIAAARAAEIARVSNGAVQTTPNQLAAITAANADEMFGELRERIADVARAYALNLPNRK